MSDTQHDDETTRESPGERLLHQEPTFDQNEGLDERDRVDADSFPASDPPQPR